MSEYILSVSLLIIAVLLIRAVFRKTVSPRAVYALWLVVVIRMALPITLFEVGVTIPEFLIKEEIQQTVHSDDEQINHILQNAIPITPDDPVYKPVDHVTPTTPTVIPITPTVSDKMPLVPSVSLTESEKSISLTPKQIINLVWFIGAVIVAAWVIFTSVTYNRRLCKKRTLYKNMCGTRVYISESADVPCISGLRPSIYITSDTVNSSSERLIMIHEYFHIRHGDHIWSAFRALALIVFWWNPLVWVAAIVSKRDAELACDDSVSSRLDDKGRIKYANILIDTIPQKHLYAVGLGSGPMKERIIMLTSKQKNRWLCLFLVIVFVVGAVFCSFTSLNEEETYKEDTSADTTQWIYDSLDEENSYTIYDFENKNVSNDLVYEGYTAEYEVERTQEDLNGDVCYDPDYPVFDFHIHLPQINDNSSAVQKWNSEIAEKYNSKFAEALTKTVLGYNHNNFLDVTWRTVTTGDVITVYIITRNFFLDAYNETLYDIYHYDTVNKRFLDTNEFLAYYVHGEYAGYTVSDIVDALNKTIYNSSPDGRLIPYEEKDIVGVIPSVFGNGKFDVVFPIALVSNSVRMMFTDYSVFSCVDSVTGLMSYHTYHLYYEEFSPYSRLTICHDAPPTGYVLETYKRGEGDTYMQIPYKNCLFFEDIVDDPPEIVRKDDGDVYLNIDHKTDGGHLKTSISFAPHRKYEGCYYHSPHYLCEEMIVPVGH